MKLKSLLGGLLVLFGAQSAHAIERMYGVIGAGYSDLEYRQAQDEAFSYKLVLGHQFHRQWYVEGGYYQLADVDAQTDGSDFGLQSDALYLGVLGKASHPVGELFYRLGVANVSVQSAEFSGTGNCEVGAAVAAAGSQTICAYDESVAAGIIGLGFDYYVATKTFIRLEAEYLRGKDGFDASFVSLGVRYNFN